LLNNACKICETGANRRNRELVKTHLPVSPFSPVPNLRIVVAPLSRGVSQKINRRKRS
jgi:hypothetical protein